jgi:hypothetical protein
VPPVVDECRAPTQVGADGNVAPLTCPNGDLNANAWQALATHDLSVMALGPGATAGEVLSAACADLAHTTKAVETSAIRLAAVYYGWGFTVDPACTPARKPPPDHHGHKGG